MDITWNGRMYVDEKQITPEQYKMFFGLYEYGISFATANKILQNRQEGNLDEIVPCDELSPMSIELILDDIHHLHNLEGTIDHEGQSLNWKWEPEINGTLDDQNDDYQENIDFFILPEWVQDKMLSDMLRKECHWGMIFD